MKEDPPKCNATGRASAGRVRYGRNDRSNETKPFLVCV